MTTILLFHHAQGQTPGFLAFAEELRAAGHTVRTPDLFGGKTFGTVEDGVAYAQETGFQTLVDRGSASAAEVPTDTVYAGFSLGVMSAQHLAQKRPGARGALFYHSCIDPSEFGGAWPQGVPLQIHMMENDPWTEEDLPVAQALVETVTDAELFLYAGSGHLFADTGSEDYDEGAATLLKERTLAFLDRVG